MKKFKNKLLNNNELINLKGGSECPNCQVWYEDHPDGRHDDHGYQPSYIDCGRIKMATPGALFYTCYGYIG